MKRLDLRLRIATTIAAACLTIVAALGVMLYMASEKMELALVEQLISEELDFLIQHHSANPEYIPTPGPNVQYYIASGEEDGHLPTYVQSLNAGQYEIDIGEGMGERDIVVRKIGNTRFIVVYNIGPYENREREFKQLILLSLLSVGILALILGYLLAGLLTRQLTILSQRVGTLVPNQPYSSLLRDEQDREVAMLAQALDQYQLLILDMIRREQEFTANVSHELRTPLTAIRTSCELLISDSTLSEKARERIRYISQAAGHMTDHTQALLFLARDQTLLAREPVALLECVNDVAAPLREQIAHKGLSLEINIIPHEMMVANRQALHLVLSNLIKNAVNYTESGFIRVSYASGKLTVSDSGVGMTAEKASRIFERSYRGEKSTDGLGLGLDIAKRICNQMGWIIEVESVPEVGSKFVVAL